MSIFQIDAPGQSFIGVPLVPRGERKLGSTEIQQVLQQDLNKLPAQKFGVFQQPSLPGAFGLPVQFAIKTTEPAARLNEVSLAFLDTVTKSGMFMFIDSDLKIDAPQSVIEIDRNKAAQLGLTMSQVGASLGSLLGGGYVNYFSMQTRSYKVIPQVDRLSRLNPDQLLNYPIATINGIPVPLSTIATIRRETVPETLNHFQQLNAATLSGVPTMGVSQAEALKYLQDLAARTLPQGYSVDYGGQLRQYLAETGGVMATFGFAIIIVFLALAALFESFRDPLVILISVPLSIAGAMIFIALGLHGASLNIYTQVGLVTLIGLISKHGILIVEVANEEQHSGKSKAAAIVAAASVRLRPDFDDHRRDGPGRGAAGVCERRRCRVPIRHRPGDLHRSCHRHLVHACSWFRASTCSSEPITRLTPVKNRPIFQRYRAQVTLIQWDSVDTLVGF